MVNSDFNCFALQRSCRSDGFNKTCRNAPACVRQTQTYTQMSGDIPGRSLHVPMPPNLTRLLWVRGNKVQGEIFEGWAGESDPGSFIEGPLFGPALF